jgi:hypothetical protein
MTDIARLGIKVDSSDVKNASRDLRNFNQTSDKTQSAARKSKRSVGELGAAFRGLAAAVISFQTLRVIDNFTLLEARVKNSTQSVREFEFSFNALKKVSQETGASFPLHGKRLMQPLRKWSTLRPMFKN